MPLLIQYLFKLFISFAIVYLFYQLVLRKLTFYNWNRWYLLGYTILSFLIPFINITPLLDNNKLDNNAVISFIPSVDVYTTEIERVSSCPVPIWSSIWDKWDWALLVFISGAGFLLLRFFIRCISFFRMRSKAQLISDNGMKLYQVNKNIIPFSFGDSIFINQKLHNEAELREIIRHEFVHVKQKHSHDIVWSELLCILNWYNPFAWLIRHAVRQNLEFIADHKVVEAGFDRKQYQYLLLRVIGNNHFRIANQFNFSSLKKRIAMMNKMKSARAHLLKFLFILPLLAVMLLAFRNEKKKQLPETPSAHEQSDRIDSIPGTPVNNKGYFVDIIGKGNNCIVVVKDRNNKEVDRVLLTKWNERESYYEGLYGDILPPAPPKASGTPVPPPPPHMPENVKSMRINNNFATVILKNGQKEEYNLNNASEKAAFEKKYGEMPAPPAPPVPPASPSSGNVENEVTITTAVPTPSTIAGPVPEPAQEVLIVSGAKPVIDAFVVTAPRGETIMQLKVYKSTNQEKLDKLMEDAKSKGVELFFDKVDFNSKNEITHISGTMKKEGSKSTFSISGFEVITLMVTNDNGKYSCLVYKSDMKDAERQL
jgi:hypothetical protein